IDKRIRLFPDHHDIPCTVDVDPWIHSAVQIAKHAKGILADANRGIPHIRRGIEAASEYSRVILRCTGSRRLFDPDSSKYVATIDYDFWGRNKCDLHGAEFCRGRLPCTK